MSLTGYLRNRQSSVREFMETHFPRAADHMHAIRQQILALPELRPLTAGSRYPFSAIGTATDYRIRYYFRATPVEELVAYAGATLITAVDPRWPLGMSRAELAAAGWPFAAFFEQLTRDIDRLSPVGRRLNAEDEAKLARYCYGLAVLDGVFRSGRGQESLATLDLLAGVESAWVEDLCTLSWAFYDSRCISFTVPVVLNPHFAGSGEIGGADGDIIADGCLIDFKATQGRGLARALSDTALYQLLGYVLLDYENEYGIRAVGFYLVRQQRLLSWALDELLQSLSNSPAPPRLDELRTAFKRLDKPAVAAQPRDTAVEYPPRTCVNCDRCFAEPGGSLLYCSPICRADSVLRPLSPSRTSRRTGPTRRCAVVPRGDATAIPRPQGNISAHRRVGAGTPL